MGRRLRAAGQMAGWAMVAFGLAAAVAAPPANAQARPGDLFYERTVLGLANGRCHLFNADMAAALGASAAQARGAALRSGRTEASLREIEGLARGRAGRIDCASPELAAAAGRARDAFAAFAKYARMSYPGDIAGWSADRNVGKTIRWRLAQKPSLPGGQLTFGLTGRVGPSALMAVGQFADGAQPYSARILVRDTARTMGAYLDRPGGGATRSLPLDRRVPPATVLRGFSATARSAAGEDLLPKAKNGWAFRFPEEAIQVLTTLDPREAVIVEFLTPKGPRRAYVEVGDFAAGRAFLQITQR